MRHPLYPSRRFYFSSFFFFCALCIHSFSLIATFSLNLFITWFLAFVSFVLYSFDCHPSVHGPFSLIIVLSNVISGIAPSKTDPTPPHTFIIYGHPLSVLVPPRSFHLASFSSGIQYDTTWPSNNSTKFSSTSYTDPPF